MPVIYKTNFASGAQPMPTPSGSEVISVRMPYAVPAAGFKIGDYVVAGYLPAGCVPVDWYVDSGGLDSGNGLTLDVGIFEDDYSVISTEAEDGGGKWVAAATVARAGGFLRNASIYAGVCPVDDTIDRPVGFMAAAATTTGVAGTLALTLLYRAAYQGA